eukprot:6246569-Pyramimonas_sp.AAC.1
MELHRRPQRESFVWASRLVRHIPHTFRGPIGSSTEGFRGRSVRMWASRPFRHAPHAHRGPIVSSAEGPDGTVHMRPPIPYPVSSYPSR